MSISQVSAVLEPHDFQKSCRHAIEGFLARMGATVPTYHRNSELERRVWDVVDAWDLGSAIRPAAMTAIAIAATSYNHVSCIDIQVFIAVYTTILTYVDDPGFIKTQPSEEFLRRYLTGMSVERLGVLGELAKILRSVWEHYSRYASSVITTSTIDFLNTTILENETQSMVLCADATPFLEYRRIKAGVAEAYTHMIWDGSKFPNESAYIQAIPDTLLYVDYVNDILSFYKEESAGEVGNYISDLAIVQCKSSLEALHGVIERTVAAAERVRRILGEGDARDAFESFARGYIAFHFAASRYRLDEVIGSQYLSNE